MSTTATVYLIIVGSAIVAAVIYGMRRKNTEASPTAVGWFKKWLDKNS